VFKHLLPEVDVLCPTRKDVWSSGQWREDFLSTIQKSKRLNSNRRKELKLDRLKRTWCFLWRRIWQSWRKWTTFVWPCFRPSDLMQLFLATTLNVWKCAGTKLARMTLRDLQTKCSGWNLRWKNCSDWESHPRFD
jgi:hypothetical protein